MGATVWAEMGKWQPDLRESLRQLHADYLAKHYDLPSLIQQHLASAEKAVALTETKGDRFGLLAGYKRDLAMLETMSREPLPASTEDRVAMLRRIYASSGQGIGNVLDVFSVSPESGVFVSRILTDAELQNLFGTPKPSRAMAETTLDRLFACLGRGESVCLPVFDDRGQPVGWWFVGCTVD